MSEPVSSSGPGRSQSVPGAGGWHYGWTIVVVGVLCTALSSPGQSFVLSLYLEPILDELRITRMGMATLYGACTPRRGAARRRPALAVAVLLLAAGVTSFSCERRPPVACGIRQCS